MPCARGGSLLQRSMRKILPRANPLSAYADSCTISRSTARTGDLPRFLGRACASAGRGSCAAREHLAATVISIRLLECEVWNRLHARGLGHSHGEEARILIARLALI